jgi:mannose-1-phosphate guanylyltransferase
MAGSDSNRWGLVLAGGDGSRLKSFTKRIAGYEMPKQFCPILGSKSLLHETLDRVSGLVAPRRTLVSVNRAHRRFYFRTFQDAPHVLIEEPRNRGTAPAILHALMRLYERDPSATIGLFPSDHYIGNETRFAEYADLAFAAADSDEVAVLLGAQATGPEQAYGWIEPETSLGSADQRLFSVRRFVEKPDARLAYELWQGGALWNTFVMVARASALLRMFITAIPRLYGHFSAVRHSLGTVSEADVLTRLYDELPISEFSEMILQRCTHNLLVMPMRGVEWYDLGEPARVMQVVRRIGVSVRWAAA